MSNREPPGLSPKEKYLYELGLVSLGSEHADRVYGFRPLSVSKDLASKLVAIAQTVVDVNSSNKSHPLRYSPWHTSRVIPGNEELGKFFGSFPYREAVDELESVLKSRYIARREVARLPLGKKVVTEGKGIRDSIEDTWKRSVEVTYIIQEIRKTWEEYNPMAEGAVRSLLQIADENPDLAERIKRVVTEYHSIPRERSESISQDILDEIIHGGGPDPDQDERWQDWTD